MIAWYWLLLMMMFAHIIADFHVQGILAELKQRSYWRSERAFYRDDYIPALICHGLEWSFITHIPMIYVFGFEPTVFVLIILNAGLHVVIDNLKCNEKIINLAQDQSGHLMQIMIAVAIAYVVM